MRATHHRGIQIGRGRGSIGHGRKGCLTRRGDQERRIRLRGLYFFGAEGFRNPSFWDARFSAGALTLSGQGVIIFMVSIALILALYLFFERTLQGKALPAAAR